MVTDSEKNTNNLKKNIFIAAITGLIIGSIAAFGVFSYVIETPLQLENEDLKAEISRVELDRSNYDQSVSDYVKQIELLRNQLKPTAAGNTETVEELQLALEATEASNAATIEELQLKLEKKPHNIKVH